MEGEIVYSLAETGEAYNDDRPDKEETSARHTNTDTQCYLGSTVRARLDVSGRTTIRVTSKLVTPDDDVIHVL